MGIQQINALSNGTRGPRWGADGSRTYTIKQEVITDGDMNEVEIVTSPLTVKPLLTFHPLDAYARCTSVSFEFDEDADDYGYLISEYSTNVPELAASMSGATPDSPPGGGGDPATATYSENPLDRRPRVTISSKMIKKMRQIDEDGRVMRNAAGDLYETMLVDVPHTVIDVERNLPDFDYTLVNYCNGSCNELPFLGYPAQKVKCEQLSAREDWEKEVFFWRVRGQFLVGNTSDLLSTDVVPVIAGTVGWHWTWKINAGYHYLSSGLSKTIFINGQKPSRPVPLNAAGTAALAPNAAVNWIAFRNFRLADLNELGLFN